MELAELLWIVNEASVIKIYDRNENEIGIYDGTDEVPDKYKNCLILDIFPDNYSNVIRISTIGIEIDLDIYE